MSKKISIVILAIMLFFSFDVTAYAESFAISNTKVTVNVGDTIDLDVTGTEKTPRWTSWNVNTAKVDQNGVVTAVRKGTTTVTARVGLAFKKCTIKVVDSSVKLNKKSAVIYTGGTSVNSVKLKATVKGASKDVVWTSSNPEVATVSNGVVISVSKGETVITATANGKSASCVVNVKESSIDLNTDSMKLSTKGNGSSIKLVPAVVGSKKSVKWSSSDKTVAIVSNGKVTGKNTGTAIITATANGISTTCKVVVEKDCVSISEEKIILYVGEEGQLKTNAEKNVAVDWTSSNTEIATVENGNVVAVKVGITIITATSNNTSDTCIVEVRDTITNIKEENIVLKTKGADKVYTVKYEVVGRESNVTWTSSNTSVVSVSKGKITAKKEGTAVITATANGISDTINVTVETYESTIKLNQSEYVLYTQKGNTYTLKANVDGPVKKATWSTSNPNVATVSNGKVTAVGEGEAIISATANGKTAECLITVKESKVILSTENMTIKKGTSKELPADVVGKSQTVKYTTTNPKVVTVKKGLIIAKDYGEADIKVTANGVTSICHVKVLDCEHTYDEGVTTKEPTCVEAGIKTYTCTQCGDSYTEDILVKAHEYTETITAPTCTEQGYTTYTCACGDSYIDNYTEIIAHSWSEWTITKEATETEEGSRERKCTVCSLSETEVIPVKEHIHSHTATITEPTCTEQGYTTHTCTCGDSYTDSFVDALGHNWGEWKVTKEPTEKYEGVKERICGKCSCSETESIPTTTHSHGYSATLTEPTCTERGYTTYTCECGDSYIDNYTKALGHSWGEWTVTKEATATEEGSRNHTCTVCFVTETEVIPVLGHEHNYNTTTIAPTCIEQGYTTYTCECGHSYNGDYVDALGHEAGEWVVDPEFTPTCINGGWERKYCVRCNEAVEHQYIEAYGHEYGDTIIKEPTCTEEGLERYGCINCDYTFYTRPIAIVHTWGEWYVTTEPAEGAHTTISQFGTRQRDCTLCEAYDSEYIINIDMGNDEIKQVCGSFCDDMAYETFTLTNELRTSLGLNELTWFEPFEDICRIRSVEMVVSYSHTRPNGDRARYNGLGLGENIALGQTSAQNVFDAWSSSEGHYANMTDERYGKYYAACFEEERGFTWVQLFYI